jgi:hypothetical protein
MERWLCLAKGKRSGTELKARIASERGMTKSEER